MLVCVPEPVCQTTSGKVIVELAVDHLARGADDGAGAALRRAGRVRGWSRAAASLTMPSARTIGIGMRSWPMRKFCRERSVCAPQ